MTESMIKALGQCGESTLQGCLFDWKLQNGQLLLRQLFGKLLPKGLCTALHKIVGENEGLCRGDIEVGCQLSAVNMVYLFPGVVNLLGFVFDVEFLGIRQSEGIDCPGQGLLADLPIQGMKEQDKVGDGHAQSHKQQNRAQHDGTIHMMHEKTDQGAYRHNGGKNRGAAPHLPSAEAVECGKTAKFLRCQIYFNTHY